jgi:hypothetical protein
MVGRHLIALITAPGSGLGLAPESPRASAAVAVVIAVHCGQPMTSTTWGAGPITPPRAITIDSILPSSPTPAPTPTPPQRIVDSTARTARAATVEHALAQLVHSASFQVRQPVSPPARLPAPALLSSSNAYTPGPFAAKSVGLAGADWPRLGSSPVLVCVRGLFESLQWRQGPPLATANQPLPLSPLLFLDLDLSPRRSSRSSIHPSVLICQSPLPLDPPSTGSASA